MMKGVYMRQRRMSILKNKNLRQKILRRLTEAYAELSNEM